MLKLKWRQFKCALLDLWKCCTSDIPETCVGDWQWIHHSLNQRRVVKNGTVLHTLHFSEQQKIVLTKLLLLKICTYNYTEKREEEEMTIDIMPTSHLLLLRNLLHKAYSCFSYLCFMVRRLPKTKLTSTLTTNPNPTNLEKRTCCRAVNLFWSLWLKTSCCCHLWRMHDETSFYAPAIMQINSGKCGQFWRETS